MRIMRNVFRFSFVAILIFGVGCGPQSQFKKARKLERAGKSYQAWERYQEFVAKHPAHKLAPQALFRAGLVAQIKLNDCFMAQTFYDRVLERYPQSDPWAKIAGLQKLNCPDYFPLLPGSSWVEGDSESKGKIAKTEIICKELESDQRGFPSGSGILISTFYAGKNKVQTARSIYKKFQGELHQYKSEIDSRSKLVLKWPLEIGTKWTARSDDRLYRFEVVGVNQIVKVRAGVFKNCIKVRSFVTGTSKAASNDYYAPGVGRVLRTVSTAKTETRVTELIMYEIAELPEFDDNQEASK